MNLIGVILRIFPGLQRYFAKRLDTRRMLQQSRGAMNSQTLEHADLVMSRINSFGDDYLAYLSVALDETGGNVSQSIKIADKCCKRSKFAKAGTAQDCGHEVAGKRKAGKFAEGNT